MKEKIDLIINTLKGRQKEIVTKQDSLDTNKFLMKNLENIYLKGIYKDETLKNEKSREIVLQEQLQKDNDYKFFIDNNRGLNLEIENIKIEIEFLRNKLKSYLILIDNELLEDFKEKDNRYFDKDGNVKGK